MMTVDEVKNAFEQHLTGKFSDLKIDIRRVFITVHPQDLLDACQVIKEKLGILHISTISGRDATTHIEVNYHFARPGVVVTVKVPMDRQSPSVPTITGLFPGAILYEREAHDILGVKFEGHPDPRRLVLPDDWPAGVYPLRKDWTYDRETEVIQ
jgi:NADH:ubiquinone oxidoreductase subunit C